MLPIKGVGFHTDRDEAGLTYALVVGLWVIGWVCSSCGYHQKWLLSSPL